MASTKTYTVMVIRVVVGSVEATEEARVKAEALALGVQVIFLHVHQDICNPDVTVCTGTV